MSPATDLNPRAVIPGDRVLLIRTADPSSPLRPGSRGTVDYADALGTIHVRWDDGMLLGLRPGVDRFELAR